MSSILQCEIGGASGASCGSLGLLNPTGMISGFLVCAPACWIKDQSSKCPLNTGGEPEFVVRPATNPSRAAVITTNGNNRFIGQPPLTMEAVQTGPGQNSIENPRLFLR